MMDKTQKIALYVGIALVGASTIMLGYHFYSKNKKNNGNSKNDKSNGGGSNLDTSSKLDITETTSSQKETATDNTDVIKLGAGGKATKGKYVALLQDVLNFLDGANLTVDGRFGKNTIDAWRKHEGVFYSFDTDFTKAELGKLIHEAEKKGYKVSTEAKKTMAKYQY